jgi:ATP-dependent DNA ligase
MIQNFRYPDKPQHSTLEYISSIREGYLGQAKINEWRILIYFQNEEIEIFTRHKTSLSDALKREIEPNIIEYLKTFNPKSLTILDGGYVGRRGKHEPSIVLFDIMKTENKWITGWQYEKRDALLKQIFKKEFEKSPCIFMPEECTMNFDGFYRHLKDCANISSVTKSKEDGLVEGIVVKHLASTLIGNRKESAINPGWLKVRW